MAKYTHTRRADAAKRGWETRREKHLAQPRYKTVDAPPEFSIGNEELAAELPISSNALAGDIPKWEDPLMELSISAHIEMRRCLAIKKGTRKLAIRTQKLNWTMVGAKKAKAPKRPAPAPALDLSPLDTLGMAADPALVAAIMPDAAAGTAQPPADPAPAQTQTRAEALAEIFGQIQGWSDFVEHCTGSLVDGTRFQQIKTVEANDQRNRSQGKWTVPDLYMGARHRFNAGGDIEWDGAGQLVQVQSTTAQASRQTKKLPLDQFAIHRPGPGSNPEGDLDLGVALYNGVVKPWNRGITSGDLWVRLFAIPAVMLGAKLDGARPDRITSMLAQRAQQMAAALQSPGAPTALSNQETVSLLQADPGGLTGIVEWQRYLESQVDDVLTLAALTSSAGLSQANRTGDTSEQKDNEDEAAFANGVQIAETFNRHILPWIIDKNPDLPPLAEGESEVYLWPNDPQKGDEQDVDVATEGAAPMDTGLDMSPLDALDTGNQAEIFEALQAKAFTKRATGESASVALAAFQPMPPVH